MHTNYLRNAADGSALLSSASGKLLVTHETNNLPYNTDSSSVNALKRSRLNVDLYVLFEKPLISRFIYFFILSVFVPEF